MNCASGLGVRRAIDFLLLVTKASITLLAYTCCQVEFSVQQWLPGVFPFLICLYDILIRFALQGVITQKLEQYVICHLSPQV